MRYWIGMGLTVVAASLVAPWGEVAVILVALGGLAVTYLWADRA